MDVLPREVPSLHFPATPYIETARTYNNNIDYQCHLIPEHLCKLKALDNYVPEHTFHHHYPDCLHHL